VHPDEARRVGRGLRQAGDRDGRGVGRQDRGVGQEKTTRADADALLSRIEPVGSLSAMAGCELVIEAGLKKCTPTKRAASGAACARRVIGMDEVLVARIAVAGDQGKDDPRRRRCAAVADRAGGQPVRHGRVRAHRPA
jgi:hypothetical protein